MHDQEDNQVMKFIEKMPLEMTVFELKEILGEDLKMDPNRIELQLMGRVLSDPSESLKQTYRE